MDGPVVDEVALCRAWIAESSTTLAARAADLPPEDVRTPSCRLDPRPIRFAPAGRWRAVHAARVDDGTATATRLVVRTTEGLWLSPIAWDVDDPTDLGCPGTIDEVAIDRVAVERGALVVVVAGERTTYVAPVGPDDPGWRMELVRTAWWAIHEPTGPRFRSFIPDGPDSQAALGTKIQPRSEPMVPWAWLPWRRPGWFTIDAGGRPSIVR